MPNYATTLLKTWGIKMAGQPQTASGTKNRFLFPLMLNVFFNMFGFMLIIPVIPDLLLEITGEGAKTAAIHGGYFLFVFALFQFLLMPFFGLLSDRIGRRPVLLFALAALCFDYLVMALADNLTTLYIGRMVAGAFGATAVTANAYICDIFKGEERAKYFGYIGVFSALGIIAGPIIGGLGSQYSVRLPFFIAAALAAINFIIMLALLKESHVTNRSTGSFPWVKANPFAFFKTAFKRGRVSALILVDVLLSLGDMAYYAVFTFVTIVKFGWSPVDIGWCLMLYGISGLIGQGLVVDRSVKRFGIDTSIIIGLTASFCVAFIIGISGSAFWIYFTIPISAFSGIFSAVITTKIAGLVPDSQQGEIHGILGASTGLVLMAGPLIMTAVFQYSAGQANGSFYDTWLYGSPFLLSALLCLLALGLFLKIGRGQAS